MVKMLIFCFMLFTKFKKKKRIWKDKTAKFCKIPIIPPDSQASRGD